MPQWLRRFRVIIRYLAVLSLPLPYSRWLELSWLVVSPVKWVNNVMNKWIEPHESTVNLRLLLLLFWKRKFLEFYFYQCCLCICVRVDEFVWIRSNCFWWGEEEKKEEKYFTDAFFSTASIFVSHYDYDYYYLCCCGICLFQLLRSRNITRLV